MEIGGALRQAIAQVVDEAARSGEVLRIPEASRRLAEAHPESGVSAHKIAELLFSAGVKARIPLEWDGSGSHDP